jgi:hypothetical protein
MSARAAAQALTPGARCATHAERGATGLCHRCGDYLCGLCAKRLEGRLFCAGCAERLTGGHAPRAARALVFGILGVNFLFFLSPVALILGAQELRAIAAGESPLGGRGIALLALWLGIAGIAMAASGVAVVVATC